MMPMIEGTWVREDKKERTLAHKVLKEVENHFIDKAEPMLLLLNLGRTA